MSKGVGWSDQTVTFSVPKKRRTPDFIPDLYVMYVVYVFIAGHGVTGLSAAYLIRVQCVVGGMQYAGT
jgi:hypothetical protein